MELADLCHDFFDPRDTEDAEVAKFISQNGYVLPEGMTVGILRNEYAFARFLSSRATVAFEKDRIKNPLHGANIFKHFQIPDRALTDEVLVSLYESQQRSCKASVGAKDTRLCTTEVWTIALPSDVQPSRKIQEIKLNQIAQLCAAIRDWMGNDCRFVIDSSDDPLVLLVCATTYLSAKFYNKFTTIPATDTISDISNKVMAHVKKMGSKAKTTWESHSIDANFFDAALNGHKLPLDRRATGNVFRNDCGYQIELQGIDQLYVTASITDIDTKISTTMKLKNRDASSLLSKNVIRTLIGIPKPPSINSARDQILSFSDPLKYALKRAGDWGQVEHCAAYDKIFVTSDKLAALYAYYRNVRFVYLYRDQSKQPYPTLVRYVFVIANRTRNKTDRPVSQ